MGDRPRLKSFSRKTVLASLFSGFGFCIFLAPYALLVWLSLGSGWTYPNLGPDRLDLSPWKSFFADGGSPWQGAMIAAVIGPCVATLSTCFGLCFGRQIHRLRGGWLFLAYLPLAFSPVIVGICLLNLFLRVGLASSVVGVLLIQTVFATGFATVFFCEVWSSELERLERLVQTLGGSRISVWRHALWPRLWQLVCVCWLQTLLFSWLDYGLVSVIGGGVVPSLTVGIVAYVREASVNQAAQAAIVLILPPLFCFYLGSRLLSLHRTRTNSHG